MDDACRLYLITPVSLPDVTGFAEQFRQACDAGDGLVAALQIRLKDVQDEEILRATEVLLPICREYDMECLINDRADLAKQAGVDGVHLGVDDASVGEARALLGEEVTIGASCYDSKDRAFQAGEQGADYVAFGAFYPSQTKEPRGKPTTELLEFWHHYMALPCVAIGGITPSNCGPLVKAGADFLAVVSSVWQFPGGPGAAIKAFKQAIREAKHG